MKSSKHSDKLQQEVMVVVRLKAKADQRAQLQAQITEVLKQSRAEPGYLVCELFVDLDDPDHFVLHERWASLEGLLRYNEQDYHRKFEETAQELSVAAGAMPTYVGNIQAARFQKIDF